ncbi:hypothetical protein EH230_09425 [Flavobacterium columnare]|uniref:Immunity protein 35 domain-containing protein n=1 Tax=Flavobacterium columnare TaxID=996 RepID=A0A437UBW9_9FLAO|nr:YrhB domain-containing protein [Flavobacterium columnare]RVU91101.1 hypothetical protein EH230_09425 [Flavobacterium columnare]
MLTDQEMLKVAERYLEKRKGTKTIDVIIEGIYKKPYGNIYSYQSKDYIDTGNFNKSLVGNAPFLVEKETGRVVQFSTSTILEEEIKAYENGTIGKSLDLYWYPDEDRFDYK